MNAVKCATVAIAAQDVDKVMGWAVDSKKFHQSFTVLRLATAEAGLKEEDCILRETLRYERDRMKHVRCRDAQSRGAGCEVQAEGEQRFEAQIEDSYSCARTKV